METVILAELLAHYRNRCQGILDEFVKLQLLHDESVHLLNESWNSPNAERMEEKLLEVERKIREGWEEVDTVHAVFANLLKGM